MKKDLPKIKVIQVCKTKGLECTDEGFVQEVGDMVHLFCCENGFTQSLLDYQKFLKNNDIPFEDEN